MTQLQLRRLVRRLGGPVAVGNHLNITSQAVSQWSRVPSHHQRAVLKLARRLGVTLTADQLIG